jgi:hypothetical protein
MPVLPPTPALPLPPPPVLPAPEPPSPLEPAPEPGPPLPDPPLPGSPVLEGSSPPQAASATATRSGMHEERRRNGEVFKGPP